MANIKGNGTPTRKTAGAIGDIYTDEVTGKQYKCAFAYRSSDDDGFDCEWKAIKVKETPDQEMKKEEPKEETVEHPVEEPKEEITEDVAKPEEEDRKEETAPAPKRKDYSSYSKRKR